MIYVSLALIFFFDQIVAAVHFSQLRLLNFAGCIAGNWCEDDFPRTLIAGHTHAEFVDLFFGTFHTLLQFHNSCGNFAQTLVRQTNDSHILDLLK